MIENPKFVVGIVGSAGSLAALTELLLGGPPPEGASFVLAEHLGQSGDTLLGELLSQRTSLDVRLAQDGEILGSGCLLIVPTGAHVRIQDSRISVVPAADAGGGLVGDQMLISLAREYEDRMIAVILSGGGHDGTIGAHAVRRHGGLNIAQAPETAEHDSMPRSAIASGCIDIVLPPSGMMERIATFARAEQNAEESRILDEEIAERLQDLCTELHRATGHDFSQYKVGTLQRRIRRRIRALGLPKVVNYLEHLRASADEPGILMSELLVGVTSFFRDPEVFEQLAAQVLPELLGGGEQDAPVRVWVPGCASGEEAYSLAILFEEEMARRGMKRTLQIFATDIDAEAIRLARIGRYSSEAMSNVSEDLRQRYFVRQGDTFVVNKYLRENCIFSTQDIIRDPPFSSLDLLSCRNVLIYLQPELQSRLLPIFHYALRRGGFLLLGPSEGLAASVNLFDPVDRKRRIFRRRDVATRPVNFAFRKRSPFASRPPQIGRRSPRGEMQADYEPAVPLHAFERSILEEFAPASIVIDLRGEILYMAGRPGRYLRHSPGSPSNNLFDQVRGELRHAIRGVLEQAVSTKRRVIKDRIPVELDDGHEYVRLTAWPLFAQDHAEPTLGLVLQQLGPVEPIAGGDQSRGPELPILEQLEMDLMATRAELQSTIEELESANEELQSSNEELQSSNEELHTSQEELQAVNEELETVNAELQEKVQELNVANDDLQNLFASTPLATIFLNNDLRITRFTPSARMLFEFIDADVGRPIANLAPRFAGLDLPADVRHVLESQTTLEREVRGLDGKSFYIVRSQPYQASKGGPAGVVTTFVDVTRLKQVEGGMRLLGELLQLSYDANIVWELNGGIEFWNRGAAELYGYEMAEAVGRQTHELLRTSFPTSWADVEARLRATGRWEGHLHHQTKDGRKITVSAKMLLVTGEDGVERVFESNRDVTAARQADRELRRAAERLRLAVEAANIAAFELDLDTGELQWWAQAGGVLGEEAPTDLEGVLRLMNAEDAAAIRAALGPGGSGRIRREFASSGSGSTERWGLIITDRMEDGPSGASSAAPAGAALGVLLDLTFRRQAEQAMYMREKLDAIGVLAGGIAHDFNNMLMGLFGYLQLAYNASDKADVRSYINAAMAAHERAAALSHRLLTFAKGGAPKLIAGRLHEVAAGSVSFALVGSSVAVSYDFDPGLPACAFDPHQMARVFENITINARQAMPDGGRVEVTGRTRDLDAANSLALPAGRYVCIAIRDTGPGIRPETLTRIFDPFFTTRDTGTGLGLATAYSIVRQHGGGVEVESIPGGGTTFRVCLPAVVDGPADGASATAIPASLSGRVLIMDDDAASREAMAGMVRGLGCQTIAVGDGKEAIECVQEERKAGRVLNAAILDLTVPGGMGGVAAAAQLSAIDPSIPLVAMSGYSNDPVIARPTEFGFAASLAKPMTLSDLHRVLSELIPSRKSE